MKKGGMALDRLLRAAASTPEAEPALEPPFGFETRVVALWRSSRQNGNGGAMARLIRSVAIGALAVTLVSTVAVVREFQQTRELGEPMTNEFAMADSAIQNEIQ